YMQYGILKDNDITDYASLARFYERGGNVGIKTEFKASENKESGLDSVDDKESKNTISNDSIASFTYHKRFNKTSQREW
ncbi:MAG: hypothetical protein MR025_01200, partial [Helicobacter trogontum]|uniref:hypothetical protein n=1 Tax=Helicobacter trogontum TaxID=50960 RepID=UPI00243234E6